MSLTISTWRKNWPNCLAARWIWWTARPWMTAGITSARPISCARSSLTMWRDDALLLDILDCSRHALEFSKEVDYEHFQKNAQLHSAVLHQLLIIGEAASKTS